MIPVRPFPPLHETDAQNSKVKASLCITPECLALMQAFVAQNRRRR